MVQWHWVRIETRGIFTLPMIAASQAKTSDGYMIIAPESGQRQRFRAGKKD